MRLPLSALALPLALIALGCSRSDESTDIRDPAVAVTDEDRSCCSPTSLRQLPTVTATGEGEGNLPTFPVPEQPAEADPEAALPAPELPSGPVFTEFPKGGPIRLEAAAAGRKPSRVWLPAEVCLRDGALEVFVCKKGTKEHESILATDMDGRLIHTALLATGAEPGRPARWEPKYEPAQGQRMRVSVYYLPEKGGKPVLVPAQKWIRDVRTGGPMKEDWVFAGSRLLTDPAEPDAKPFYAANNGEFVSLSNFVDSMLDVGEKSSQDAAQLLFEAETKHVPPLLSKVWVVLEPIGEE